MNQKGSVLVSVLLLAGLLILLAVPVLQVANAGYKTSVNEQVRTQAFYIAEAGLEHSKQLVMDALRAGSVSLPTSDEVQQISAGSLDSQSLGSGAYDTTAEITRVSGNKYQVEIVSTATIEGSSIAQRSRLSFPLSIRTNIGNAAKWALYSHEKVNFPHQLTIEEGAYADFEGEKLWFYPVDPPDLGSIQLITGNRIAQNGYYQGISLTGKTLEITTENVVREVRLQSIELHNGGNTKASIKVTGGGRLRLYVDGNISAEKQTVLIETPDLAIVEIYCMGTSVRLIGPPHEGQPIFTRTLLYAPLATLKIDNHVETLGAMVVNNVSFLSGSGNKVNIAHDPVFKDDDFEVSLPELDVDPDSRIWSPR